MIVIASPGPICMISPQLYSRAGSSYGRTPRKRYRRRFLLGAGSSAASVFPAGTSSQVQQIVLGLCNYPNCNQPVSGSNKHGYLVQFWVEAVTSRFLPEVGSSAAAQGILDANINCSGYPTATTSTVAQTTSLVATGAKIAAIGGTVAGAVAGGTAAGAAIGSVVPVVGTIVGAIAGLIGALFGGGHAKAVAGEEQDLCTSIPQANAILQQIDSGLASGQVQPSEAQSLYSQLQSSFTSALHQNTTFKTGDTLWAYSQALVGIIQARNQDLAAGLLTGGGSLPTGVAAAIGAATGLPAWALLAGAVVLIYALL